MEFTLQGPLVTRWSDDELLRCCLDNPYLGVERDEPFNVVIIPPTRTWSGRRSLGAGRQLANWNAESEAGEAFDSSTDFRLPDGSVRSPDPAWVARTRPATIPPGAREGFAPVCPDFVIEMKSPSNDLAVLRRKMARWVENGCRLARLLVPETQTTYTYAPERPEEALTSFDRRLSGEAVLPGFFLDLSRINR
ncbi:MAG: Uma2 family endonuclease [Catalinimonas sp.]